MTEPLDPDDPMVDELVRAAAPPEGTARRRWIAGLCVAGLAVSAFGWFVPGMPTPGLIALGVLAVVTIAGLIWVLAAGILGRRR